MSAESLVKFRTLDGLRLAGTFVAPYAHGHGKAVVLATAAVSPEKRAGSSHAWPPGWQRQESPHSASTFADTVRAKANRKNSR